MHKLSSTAILFGLCFLGAGCVSNVKNQVVSAVEKAPEWFENRRDEVVGQGYPDLRDVPQGSQYAQQDKDKLRTEDEALLAEAENIRKDPQARSPSEEEDREDPNDWADDVRSEFSDSAGAQ